MIPPPVELQLIASDFGRLDRSGVESLPTRLDTLTEPVRGLIRESLATNTRRAYASDLATFTRWGGSIPATPSTIANFIANLATTHAVASVSRMVSALGKAHRSAGLDDPTGAEVVKATMAGIRRVRGSIQRQARPILREDLFTALDLLGNRAKDVRDRAILLVGFASAVRRSELVALDVSDVELSERGMLITVRRSKTDQDGKGRQIAIPHGRTRHCPVAALSDWLSRAGVGDGAIFRGVDKHGNILDHRLSGEAVSQVIKARLATAGYNPQGFSGHSLRAGFVTAAAMAGAPSHKIREATGHRSEASLARYIRQVDLFSDPAVARVL